MAASSNPFLNPSGFYVPPTLSRNLAALPGGHRAEPAAIWVDTRAAVLGLEHALQNSAQQSKPPMVVVVLYNLPNRDCAAKASAGEITCGSDTSCEAGIAQYHEEFILPCATLFSQYGSVPVAVILEPDSLPNVVTNLDEPGCGSNATQAAYRVGLSRAVATIKRLAPRVAVYLDAGHGRWMGWDANAQGLIQHVCDTGLYRHVRGFATNVTAVILNTALCPAPLPPLHRACHPPPLLAC